MSGISTGKEGENLAVNFLRNIGYKILEKNYRFGHGEIDIIAEDSRTLVFVEVKYRKSLKYGHPEDAVTKRKISQIKKIAEAYLSENQIYGRECRLDVIAILKSYSGKHEITHYKNIGLI